MEQEKSVVEVEVTTLVEVQTEEWKLEEIKVCNENPLSFHDYAKLDVDFVVSSPVETTAKVETDTSNNADLSKEDNASINSNIDNPSSTNSEVYDCLLQEISATFLKDIGNSTSASNNDSSDTENNENANALETDVNKDLKNDIFHYLVTASVIDGAVAFSYTKMDVANVLDSQNKSGSEGDASNVNSTGKRLDKDNNSNASNSNTSGITTTRPDDPISGANQVGDFLEGETNSELVTKGSDMMKLVTLNGWQLFVHEESKKYGVDFGSISSTMKSLWSEMGEQERKAYNIRGQIGILLEPCDKCGRTFSTFNKRNEHVSGCGPTECLTCNKVFDDERKMKQHAMRHTQKFFCFVCHTSWESASKLRRHQEKHNKRRAWPCEYCGKRYSQRYNLNAHHRRKHPEKI